MESKWVKLEFTGDGKLNISYLLGEKEVGAVKSFESVPKRYKVLLDKFPLGDVEAKVNDKGDTTDETATEA